MQYGKKWYEKLNKSPYTPPDYIFRIVWTILYSMMAISFYLVWSNKKCFPFCNPLILFIIQLIFNLAWTNLFFVRHKPKWALIDIVLMKVFTLLTLLSFYKISTTATILLIPYYFWLSFAFYLNLYIVRNN